MRKLKLSLHRKWFNLMFLGVKSIEVRTPSKWIKSRLFDSDGKIKNFDSIEFRNGYGENRPVFEAEFLGYYIQEKGETKIFEGGNKLKIEKGDFVLKIGKIISNSNIPSLLLSEKKVLYDNGFLKIKEK